MIQKPDQGNKSKLWGWVVRSRRVTVAFAKRHPFSFAGGLLGTLAMVVLALFAWSIIGAAVSLERDASELLASLRGRDVEKLAAPEAYAGLVDGIENLEDELETLRRGAGLLKGFQWVPGLGTRAKEANLLLEMGDHFARGTRLTLQGYSPVAQAIGAGGGQIDRAALQESLESAGPLFAEGESELAKAREVRARLGTPRTLGSRGDTALRLMDQYIPLLELAVAVGNEAPQLVGEVLELRNSVSDLRHTLAGPAALLQRPEDVEAIALAAWERGLSVQRGLLQVKNAVEGGDPRVNQAVDTALQMSVLLVNLSEGLARFAGMAEEVFAQGLLTSGTGELLGKGLPEVKEALQAAQQQLAQLNTLLAAPREGDQGGSALATLLGGALGSPALPLQREESLLATAAKTVDFLTAFLGYDGPKRYLLIGQNDDEIRATGGFVGVVAELTIERGKLMNQRYLDSTTVDRPPYDTNPLPPEPIYRYLWMARLLFRDGNWNPHFPASAAQLADLYERGQGVKVDGVIAATEEVVLDLVDAFANVRVPEVPEPLTRRRAEMYVEGELPYPCLPRHVSQQTKRCFDEDLFQVIIGKLLAPMPPQEREKVVQVLLNRLGNKDLLLHVFDTQTAELLWERDWNGALKQVDHDYLLIVDSSLPGHARAAVERRVQYQITLAIGQPLESELLIEYRHRGKTPDPNCRQALPKPIGCYWNYLRVYIPVVAQEIDAPPIPMHEGSEWLIWGYEPTDSLSVISSPRGGLAAVTEIGGYLPVEPQTNVTLPMRYRLPASYVKEVGGGVFQYRLLVQKQGGAPVEPVTIFVQLPQGATLLRASPASTAQLDRWVRIDVDLAGDTTFIVDFRTP